MKRHSILTTIFPRLGFNNHSIDELKRRYARNVGPRVRSRVLSPSISTLVFGDKNAPAYVVVPNLFQPMWIRKDLALKTHLFYHEIQQSSSQHTELFERDTDLAKVVLFVKARKRDEADSKSFTHSEESHFLALVGLLSEPEIAEVVIEMHIYVSGRLLPKSAKLDDFQRKSFNAERKELIAQELTTGYRRFVNLLIELLYAQAQVNRQRNMDEAYSLLHIKRNGFRNREIKNDDDHSTIEDGWRLLCCFHSVQVAAKKINLKHWKHPVLSISAFIQSLTNADKKGATAFKIINYLFVNKSIKREIALKKCLEYYIYESVSDLPSI